MTRRRDSGERNAEMEPTSRPRKTSVADEGTLVTSRGRRSPVLPTPPPRPTTATTEPDLRTRPGDRARPPRRVPRRAGPDARPHRGLDSSAAGDWVSQKFLESAIVRADEGARRRPDRAAVLRPARLRPDARRRARRAVLHRPPARQRRGRRPDGRRLAGPDQPGVLPGQQGRADGRRAAPAVRLPARRDDGLRGRGARCEARRRGALARSSRRRSSGRASARCATSSPPSSPSRTSSSAPTWTSRSACRAPRAPARPRSACTARRSCSTPTATSSPGRACWWSGPNASFLRYIGDVLPALGEIDAQQTTIEELVGTTLARLNAKYAVRGADAAAVADAQGRRPARRGRAPGAVVAGAGARPRACWCRAARDAGASRRTRWRRSSPRCAAAGSGTAPPAAMLAQRLAHGILVKMEIAGDSPDDRVQDAVARSREVKRYVDQVWPAVDPARLVLRLLGDADFLAAAADGVLDRRGAGAAAVGQAVQGARRRRGGRWPTRC